jgi:hypothetical protein
MGTPLKRGDGKRESWGSLRGKRGIGGKGITKREKVGEG